MLRNLFLPALFVITVMAMAIGAGCYYIYVYHPAHINFTGGTELLFVVDFSTLDRNIASLEHQYSRVQQKEPDAERNRYLFEQLDEFKRSKALVPNTTADVMRRRIDPSGTRGYRVEMIGPAHDQLRVQLPKMPDAERDRIKTAITTQGRLTFHINTDDAVIIDAIRRNRRDETEHTIYADENGIDYEEMLIRTPKVFFPKEYNEERIVVHRVPGMDGSHIVKASAHPDRETGKWEIAIQFDPSGSVQFAHLTGWNIKRRLAIVLDNEAQSAPTIQGEIAGTCQITGNFSKEQAERLATALTQGSLPVELKLQSQQTIGPIWK